MGYIQVCVESGILTYTDQSQVMYVYTKVLFNNYNKRLVIFILDFCKALLQVCIIVNIVCPETQKLIPVIISKYQLFSKEIVKIIYYSMEQKL